MGNREQTYREEPRAGRCRCVGRCSALLALGGAAGMAAAVCYSSFLLAGPLGSRLSPLDSFVSELEVHGQPESGFFRATDVVAGVLIVTLALAMSRALPSDRRSRLGCLALGGIGAASLCDAINPMPCTPSTDAMCRWQQDSANLSVQFHQAHTVSSVLGGVAAVASMLLLGEAVRASPHGAGLGGWAAQLLGLILCIVGCAEVVLTFRGAHGVGVFERAQILAESAWFSGLGCYLWTRFLGHGSASKTGESSRPPTRGPVSPRIR